jgi:hypothetical protein
MEETTEKKGSINLNWINLFLITVIFIILFDKSPEPSSQLSPRVTIIENELKKHSDEISSINTSIFSLKYFPALKSTVTFSPDAEGFQPIETSVGNIYVMLEKIEPYANGHKVTFSVGNPYAADIINVKTKIAYGMPFNEFLKQFPTEEQYIGKASYDTWQSSLRVTEKDIAEGLSARSWNLITFILAPSKPEEVGALRLTIEATGLSLYQKPQK